jgi:hypothetical protein
MNWKEICPICGRGCNEVMKLNTGERMIVCPDTAVQISLSLPGEYRQANQYDVFINKQPREGVKVLLKSFHGPTYQAYVIKSWTDAEWLSDFVKAGQCFIRK